MVDDISTVTLTRFQVDGITIEQVFLAEPQCRGKNARGIDGCCFTEDHAAGVNQRHLAVGRNAAKNRRGRSAHDAADKPGRRIGLGNQDRLIRRQIKAVELHQQVLRKLVDVRILTVDLGERTLSVDDLAAFRRRVGQGCQQQ